jgi:hypothetical protein
MLTRFNSPDGTGVAFSGGSWSARSSGAAQRPQKLFSGRFFEPQRGQKIANAEPQWPQNFIPSGFVNPHRGHVIRASTIRVTRMELLIEGE